MNRATRPLAFLFLAMCQAALAAAQTVPSSFKDMQFLVGTGDRVTVVDTSGARITGRISEMDASTLVITSGSGPHRFTQNDVIVVRQRKADPLKNGAVIGAVMGAGMGLLTELSCGGADEVLRSGRMGHSRLDPLGCRCWRLHRCAAENTHGCFQTRTRHGRLMERVTRDRSRRCGRARCASLVVFERTL